MKEEDLTPLVHRGDPETSREAVELHAASGRLATNREVVLAAVRRKPGRTAVEMLTETNLERHEVSRRLSDLESAGLIRKGLVRLCEVKRTKMATWYPVEDA